MTMAFGITALIHHFTMPGVGDICGDAPLPSSLSVTATGFVRQYCDVGHNSLMSARAILQIGLSASMVYAAMLLTCAIRAAMAGQ